MKYSQAHPGRVFVIRLEDGAVTGCVRKGVKVWQVMEVILHELTGSTGMRKTDEITGFALLVP